MSFAVLPLRLVASDQLHCQDLRVLLALTGYAGSKGVAWPKLSTLESATSLGRRTVQRSLRRLTSRSCLDDCHQSISPCGTCSSSAGPCTVFPLVERITQLSRFNGGQGPNRYKILFSRWDHADDPSASTGVTPHAKTVMGGGDTGDTGGVSRVTPPIEQHCVVEHTPPDPPAGGVILTRNQKKYVAKIHSELESTVGGACAGCNGVFTEDDMVSVERLDGVVRVSRGITLTQHRTPAEPEVLTPTAEASSRWHRLRRRIRKNISAYDFKHYFCGVVQPRVAGMRGGAVEIASPDDASVLLVRALLSECSNEVRTGVVVRRERSMKAFETTVAHHRRCLSPAISDTP